MRRCHLLLVCPWESFAEGLFSQRYLTAGASGCMGQIPQQPVPRCLDRRGCGGKTAEIHQRVCLSLCRQPSSAEPAISWCPVSKVLLSSVGDRDRHPSGNSLWARNHWHHAPFPAGSRSAISHPSDSSSAWGGGQEH